MKSRTLTCITAITLFAALTLVVPLAAQQHPRYKVIDIVIRLRSLSLCGVLGWPSGITFPASQRRGINAVKGTRIVGWH
jgi:hypothetical protein